MPESRYHEAADITPKLLQYLDYLLHSVNIKTRHRNKGNLRRHLCGNHKGTARLWLHPVDGPIPSLAFNHGFLHSAYMNIVEIGGFDRPMAQLSHTSTYHGALNR